MRGGGGDRSPISKPKGAYLPNLRTFLSLEPLEKVPGGGWWVGGGVNLKLGSA